MPFCPPVSGDQEDPSLAAARCDGSWRPADIHEYLRRETEDRLSGSPRNNPYNEFIVDGRRWDSGLPNTIDAFIDGGPASEIREAFLARFGLARADVPLVKFSGRRGVDGAAGALELVQS